VIGMAPGVTWLVLSTFVVIQSLRKVPLSSASGERVRDDRAEWK